ncbi:MAG UNVERIFIED_CONTAM: hypothetical protein LVR29_02335 [Microcystis novacekii LVE1205-3]
MQKQHKYDKEVMNTLQELLNWKSERNRLEGHDNWCHIALILVPTARHW